jgi:hypothetical protein
VAAAMAVVAVAATMKTDYSASQPDRL